MHSYTTLRLFGIGLAAILFLVMAAGITAETDAEQATELNWDALIPKDYVPENPLDKLSSEQLDQLSDSSPEAIKLLAEMEYVRNSAPVVEELNGKLVRLPGFVVPLAFDGTDVDEFLLVPYFGACIHVPPPPANQIVYVKAREKLAVEGLFAAVWVTGRMKTEHASNDLAEAGYTLDAHEVKPYE